MFILAYTISGECTCEVVKVSVKSIFFFNLIETFSWVVIHAKCEFCLFVCLFFLLLQDDQHREVAYLNSLFIMRDGTHKGLMDASTQFIYRI